MFEFRAAFPNLTFFSDGVVLGLGKELAFVVSFKHEIGVVIAACDKGEDKAVASFAALDLEVAGVGEAAEGEDF